MQEASGRGTVGRGQCRLCRWIPFLLILVLTAVALWQGWHKHLSLESLAVHEKALRAHVDRHFAVSLAAYAGLYTAAVALSLPGGLILTMAGGLLFGWLVGGMVALLCATVGATIIFLLARSSLGEALAARAGPRISALREGFRRDALNYLLFLRLVPAFPFWLVNLAPALLGVQLPTFVIATFLGIIPGTFAFAVVGSGLGSVIAAQRSAYEICIGAHGGDAAACSFGLDASALVTPGLLAAFAALGVLALVPVVAKKVMGRRSGGE